MDTPQDASLRLRGHEEALTAFRHAFEAGRLHHAWLLCGPEGTGKAALAFRMARIVLNGENGESPAGRRITAGTHADLLSISRAWDEKKNRLRPEIVADEIRPVASFLHRTAAEGGWRVVIIDSADTMNRNAANALLKVLEEPPPDALLILTASAPGRLLPTIRSRCRTLPLRPLETTDLQAVLARAMPEASADDITHAADQAGGSAGRGITLLSGEFRTATALAEEAMNGVSVARAIEIADKTGRDENAAMLFLSRLTALVAERARTGALARHPSADRSARLWENLRRLTAETERFSLDRQEALIEAINLVRSS
ncbi:DNA polymerase III subunit delta' [Acetobacter sp. AN02]|uniref:DNA polymerase III subunit delta' n=1 Tax=Acetobacter sp. AN02 TaxID=2894186 RepID=UPI00243459F5|nr:DNA polymerase III subunit delta' [Acetobacter sp. AN02]MDG6093771.1 DNA polymerase III subunit delta' [Acetobacter sp. AN02]